MIDIWAAGEWRNANYLFTLECSVSVLKIGYQSIPISDFIQIYLTSSLYKHCTSALTFKHCIHSQWIPHLSNVNTKLFEYFTLTIKHYTVFFKSYSTCVDLRLRGREVVQYDKLGEAEKRFVQTFLNFCLHHSSQYPTNLDVNAPFSQNPPQPEEFKNAAQDKCKLHLIKVKFMQQSYARLLVIMTCTWIQIIYILSHFKRGKHFHF